MDRPRIARLYWDGWNIEHVTKHGITPPEAGEVIVGKAIVNETYKQRVQFVGPSASGRILSVVVGRVPHTPDVWYVFSARPASRKERAAYAQSQAVNE